MGIILGRFRYQLFQLPVTSSMSVTAAVLAFLAALDISSLHLLTLGHVYMCCIGEAGGIST